MRKFELHIKSSGNGFMVAYKDGKTWRCCTGIVSRNEAIGIAKKLTDTERHMFLKTICDCGTEF